MASAMDDPSGSGFGGPRDEAFAANDVLCTATPGPFDHPNPDPGPAYRATFTQDVKDNIVNSVRYAYQIVHERYDETLGFNATTFGGDVYHVGTFQLGKYCTRSGGKLERVQELKSLCRFRGGPFTLGFYKVGFSVTDNIWEHFPTSENGAISATDEGHPILVGLEDAMIDRVDELRYVVVAHMGNPTDGLCAVYLCIPIHTEGGKIKRWGYAEAIYQRTLGNSAAPPPPPPGGPPPENPELPIAPAEEPEADVVVTAR
jgi:hypothetical protein